MDIFALIQGSVLLNPVGPAEAKDILTTCELGAIIALDPGLTLLTRSWCLFEVGACWDNSF